MDDASAVGGVYELVGPLPLPLVLVPLRPLPVHVGDEAGDRDPEDEADHHDRPHDVVLEELEDGVQVEVVDEVPDALHHVLHRALALTPIAKSLVAGRPVREPVGPALGVYDGEAGRVQVSPAAPEALDEVRLSL